MTRNLAWTVACTAALVACGGTTAQREPPTAPQNLEATPGDGVVGLRWDAVAGAEGYTVYWSTAPGVTRATGTAIQTQTTTLNHVGLDNGVTHHYVVTAANAAGESPESAEVLATPLPAYEPLTVAKAGTGGGSVISAPPGIDCGSSCAASPARGSTVTLTATPDATSTLDGWSGDCSGTGECTVAMDDARSVTATFTRITHQLAVIRAGTGGGTVTSDPVGIDCGATCAAAFDAGTAVTLTATPDATSTFQGWSGACTGTGPCTVTVGAAASVTATFTRVTHGLSVSKAGTGAGTVTSTPAGIDCGATCAASYETGTTVTLSAAPDATSTFAGWSGAGCSGTGSCVVTVDAARSVTATFTRITYPLSVGRAGTGGGRVTSSPAGIDCGAACVASYDAGTAVVLTAVPDATSTFAGWSGACTGTGACTVTMGAAALVSATFTRITYLLSVGRAGTGGGTVASTPAGIDCGATCAASYDTGTAVTLSATPDATSIFGGWSGAGCSGTGSCIVTVDAARSVTATFTRITYLLSVGLNGTGGGMVTSTPAGISCTAGACPASYDAGTTVVLTATPDATSTFAGWSGGVCSGAGNCAVTMSGATSVTATFTRITYPLSVALSGTGGGGVSSTPAGIGCWAGVCTAAYDAGTTVLLSATPDATSTFAGWSGGGCSGTGSCAVTMAGASSVTATFTRKIYSLSVTRTGGGSVSSTPSGIACGATCAADYQAATTVVLTASPDAGATFAGWTGACSGASTTCTVTMDAARAVSARFTYPLTVSRSGTGTGTVTTSPAGISCGASCSASYDGGSGVTLTATSDSVSDFAGWSGAGCSGTGTCVVTMDAAKSVNATFTRRTHTLSVSRSGQGWVTSSPAGIDCGWSCSAVYGEGTVVTLTASGSGAFLGWTGACSGTGACTVTMNAARSVGAVFTNDIYVSKSGTGAGTVTSSPAGIDCGPTCSNTRAGFAPGTAVTLTATPDATSVFTGWSGSCSGTGTCTVTADNPQSVTASFSP